MSSGLISGISSGVGQSIGTSAAGSAAGAAAAEAAGTTTAGTIGSAIGQGIGGAANGGVAGPATNIFDHGTAAPADNTTASSNLHGATEAADPKNSKGGWLGMGLFGNDQYNPNPSSYAPSTGNNVAQAAKPKPKTTTPIALQLMNQLPVTNPQNWMV